MLISFFKVAILLAVLYAVIALYLWFSYGRNIHRGDG